MNKKALSELTRELPIEEAWGPASVAVTGVSHDSRSVKKGEVFVAIKGQRHDGHQVIEEALKAGAVAVIHSSPLERREDKVSYIRVENTRAALSKISAAFYDYPSKKLTVIGVTGTDGKSTTVYFIQQLLALAGEQVGYLSTVSYASKQKSKPNVFGFSTPEAPELHRLLREMVDAGKKYVVLEATSHALSPKSARLLDVDFDVGILTNLTEEHLDFHGTFEQYRDDKGRLFQMVAKKAREGFVVLNGDGPWLDFFIKASGEVPVYTYSTQNDEADLYATDIVAGHREITFVLQTPQETFPASLPFGGRFNLENLLASLVAVSELLEICPEDFLDKFSLLRLPEGRMDFIQGSNKSFEVMVDFAHTPMAYQSLIPPLREECQGSVITLFGCPGDRYRENRPLMGSIADQYSDFVVLTADQSHSEEPEKIIEEIAEGIKRKKLGETLFIVPNRKEAMKKALDLVEKGGLILSLGVGHERALIYADKTIPWNEREVWEALIAETPEV